MSAYKEALRKLDADYKRARAELFEQAKKDDIAALKAMIEKVARKDQVHVVLDEAKVVTGEWGNCLLVEMSIGVDEASPAGAAVVEDAVSNGYMLERWVGRLFAWHPED